MKILYRSPQKNILGFTLIELMLTLAILGVVLAIGVPTFNTMIANNRLTAQTNQAIGIISFARSEASKRTGTTITVCGSSDEATCNTSNWESGWLIMNDVDGDRTLDAGDQLLQVGSPLNGGNTLRTSGFASTAFIQFDSEGSAGSAGTLVICDSRGVTKAKGIVLSVIGQSRLAQDSGGNGVVENHLGVDVTCP